MPDRNARMFISSVGALLLTSCVQSASAPSPSSNVPASSIPSASQTITAASPSPVATAAGGKPSPKPVPDVRPSDLVIRHEGVGDTCCPVPWVVLTADGRYVTRTDDNQLRERKLTPAGVQRVRDEIAGTGLFERDLRIPLEFRGDERPPAHGIGGLTFRAWRDTRIVEVHTAMDQGAEESYYQPSAARTRLDRLSKQLLRPETWLSADAWADLTPRQYAPVAFALLLAVQPGVQNATPTVDELSATWPFSVGPRALGEPLPPVAGPFAETTRCLAVTRDDMLAVKESILRAGGSDAMQTSPEGGLGLALGMHDQQSGLILALRPLLPDHASCSGEYVQ